MSPMIQDLIAKYDERIPRYTSYPTAPHFHSGITPEIFAGWLADLPAAEEISLYLHIPFCEELCWFCGCHTQATHDYGRVSAYAETLKKEIALAGGLLSQAGPRRVRHLHFGGGSPSILSPSDFLALVAAVRQAFDLVPGAEIAVELDPRTTHAPLVAALAEAGVNRISLGVQELDAGVQKAIHRIQPFPVVKAAVDALRAAGIRHVNMDLMYGLPRQTTAMIADTVAQILRLAPDRLAVFGYAHVPWMCRHQSLIAESALPDAPARWDQAMTARNELTGAGYVPIGFDHYAHPGDDLALALEDGTLTRNFQGYTDDPAATLVGLGASGISELPQGYAVNTLDLDAWSAAVTAGRPATARGIAVSADDALRRAVIRRLMCEMSADVGREAARFGADPAPLRAAMAGLVGMEADGLVALAGDRIAVTEAGRPFVRAACAAFDTYLVPGEARHSRNV